MNHIEVYSSLRDAYMSRVERERDELDALDPTVKPDRVRNENIVLDAFASVRGPFFREDEAPETNPLGQLDALRENMYIREELRPIFAMYNGANAEYIDIFEKSDEETRKAVAIYASCMLQSVSELDALLGANSATGMKQNERMLRCFALCDLYNGYRIAWRLCAPPELRDFKVVPRDIYCRLYFALREPVFKLHCECKAAADSVSDRKGQMSEFRAVKIRGGAIFNIDAVIFNSFSFGGLRGLGEYFMLDTHLSFIEEAGVFDRFKEEFVRLDERGRKMLSLYTITLVTIRRLRDEKLTKFDGAAAVKSEKEMWETGIYIDAFNELERAFIAVGREFDIGGFLYE